MYIRSAVKIDPGAPVSLFHPDLDAARAVMRKAKDAADSPPETIKTDRLRSYQSAVKDVFPDAKHIQSDGIPSKDNNNNRSERVQGTLCQRTKTMRDPDSRESGHGKRFEHLDLGQNPEGLHDLDRMRR